MTEVVSQALTVSQLRALCSCPADRPISRLDLNTASWRICRFFCGFQAASGVGSLLGSVCVFFTATSFKNRLKKTVFTKKIPDPNCKIIPEWKHFFVFQKMPPQITEGCLQQSRSLSSHCFHDNGMTCLVPPREGGREDEPCLFHCAKMPSLHSTARLSQTNRTRDQQQRNATQCRNDWNQLLDF